MINKPWVRWGHAAGKTRDHFVNISKTIKPIPFKYLQPNAEIQANNLR